MLSPTTSEAKWKGDRLLVYRRYKRATFTFLHFSASLWIIGIFQVTCNPYIPTDYSTVIPSLYL
jgi:hypothetical protein